MIKAVIFDVDGVLLDSFEASLIFFQDLVDYLGYKLTRDEFSKIFFLPLRDSIRKLTGSTDEKYIDSVVELRTNKTVPYPVDMLKMPDGVSNVLSELSKSYKLGIVTSRLKESVFEFPDFAALKEYFQTVITYENTQEHKPHPEPMFLAAQRLDVLPSKCVYIGDAQVDLEAAQAAGMRFINYAKTKLDDVKIWTDDFSKIPELIEKL